MNTRIFKIYMLIVIILISIFPLYYVLKPDFENFNYSAPDNYKGIYHVYKSHDGLALFARIRQVSTDKPLLVLLPDNSLQGNYLMEMHMADSLQKLFRVVSPDYRSTGKSERIKNPNRFSLDNYLLDIEALRLSLNANKLSFVGHGFGALLAKMYEKEYPNYCAQVIMINPIVDYNSAAQRTARKISQRFEFGPDDMRPTVFYDMHGYASEEELGFFATMKIWVSAEYFKVNYSDTLNADRNHFQLAIDSKLYLDDEIYQINQASHIIGFLFSYFKSEQKNTYITANQKNLIIVGSDDSWTDTKVLSEWGYRIKEVQNASFYPYLDNSELFYDILMSELRSK